MDNRLIWPITIVVASLILGGSFYATQINKQNSIERQQQLEIDRQTQQDLEEQQASAEMEEKLNTCLETAETNYTTQWNNECERLGRLTNSCIKLLDMSYEDYEALHPISTDGLEASEVFDLILERHQNYTKEREDCSCALPTTLANSVNESLKDSKDQCFRRYPVN